MKVSEGRKAWVKNPEKLENCSTGFHFPQQEEEAVKGQVNNITLHNQSCMSCNNFVGNWKRKKCGMQEERVQCMKLVRFYRVEL